MKGFKAKELIKIFINHGWLVAHRKSSHVSLTKDGHEKIITVVENNNKEVCRPLARRLLKEAGISL